MSAETVSPPQRWLTPGPVTDALPPESPAVEPPPLPQARPALPAPRRAVPPGTSPAPTQLATRQALPLQPHGQLPLWPDRGRQTAATIAPRAVGEISHDFSGHMLGFSTMAVSIGAIVGTRYGGTYGGVGGSLLGGSLVNIYRAVRFAMEGTDAADREAIVSGTYALAAAGFGAAVIYKLDRRRRVTPNAKPAARNEQRNCGFRPTGT